MTTEHTYAALVELIHRTLAHQGERLDGTRRPDPGSDHRAPADLKLDLLTRAYAWGGPGAIRATARQLPTDPVRAHPFVRVLLARRSPVAFCQTWSRLESYGHSQNRTVFDRVEDDFVTLSRVTRDGRVPSFVENLFIVELLRTLLEALGARSLRCEASARGFFWSDDHDVSPDPLVRRAMTWTLAWTSFTPTAAPGSSRPELVRGLFPGDPLLERLVALLADDPGGSYPLAEVSRLLAVSVRSLQRRLAGAATTDGSVVRRIRVAAAVERMTDTPLTMVAYACGFSDGAHLSRDVRRVLGASPSELRALLTEPLATTPRLEQLSPGGRELIAARFSPRSR